MTTAINKANIGVGQFFTVAEARQDRWRKLLTASCLKPSFLETARVPAGRPAREEKSIVKKRVV